MKHPQELTIAGLGEVLWDMLPDGRQCGGAPANVIFHASKLGAQGLVVSAVGADADGDDLLAFLKGKKIGGLPAISFSLKEVRLETDDNKENEQDG